MVQLFGGAEAQNVVRLVSFLVSFSNLLLLTCHPQVMLEHSVPSTILITSLLTQFIEYTRANYINNLHMTVQAGPLLKAVHDWLSCWLALLRVVLNAGAQWLHKAYVVQIYLLLHLHLWLEAVSPRPLRARGVLQAFQGVLLKHRAVSLEAVLSLVMVCWLLLGLRAAIDLLHRENLLAIVFLNIVPLPILEWGSTICWSCTVLRLFRRQLLTRVLIRGIDAHIGGAQPLRVD